MQFEIKHIFNVIITFQLVFFSIFLLTQKRGIRISNQIFAVILLSNAMVFMDQVFRHFDNFLYNHFPHLFYLNFPFAYLYPPLLYLYTKSLTNRGFVLNKKHLYHFIPFILACIFIILRYHIYSADVKRELLIAGPRHDPLFDSNERTLFSIFAYGQFFSYAIVSLIVLRHYQTEVKKYFSSVDKINLSWLKFILAGFILWKSVNLIYYFFIIFSGIYSVNMHILFQILILMLASVIIFRALRQPEIFLGFNGNNAKKKYEKSLLPAPERERYLQRLLNYMEFKKPYLDPSINLHSLAEQLAISPHHLSQVLNESLQQNFFDFINSYRIKESQRLLSHPSKNKTTILEILYDTGFNSKSVFNTAFKKHTGMTPTEFRKSHNKY